MFNLTSDITIGTHEKIKPAKVSWKTDINSFTDTCTIELPRISYLKTIKTATADKQQPNERKEYLFKENDKVSVLLGYDFKQRLVDKNVRVVIHEKDNKGEVKKTKSDVQKYSNEKTVKVKVGIPADLLKQIANRLQTKSNYNGFEGSVTAFLEPAVNKGMVADITDKQYTNRTGRYFIESVEGEFGTGGGRQKIGLGFLMQ